MSRPAEPVACRLGVGALEARRALLATLTRDLVERRQVPHGVALGFPADGEVLAKLVQLIDLERRCCPFVRFVLTVGPEAGPVWLELYGPEGSEEFLRSLV